MKFWRLKPDRSRGQLVLRIANSENFDDYEEVVAGRRLPPEDGLWFSHYMGRRQTDMVGATPIFVFPVSRRFVETLTLANATGWTTLPIRVRGRTDLEQKYNAFVVKGRCGPLSYGHRGTRKVPIGDGSDGRFLEHEIGLSFDIASWDGSDVFVGPSGLGAPLVTQKVVDAVRKARLTGIEQTPIDEYLGRIIF